MSVVLDRYAGDLEAGDSQILADVQEYARWLVGRRNVEFDPSTTSDVDIRTFLLSQRMDGAGKTVLERKKSSLEHFYEWACKQGIVRKSPFEMSDLRSMRISGDQIRRREEKEIAGSQERELAHLRALNQLAEKLNRAVDLKGAIEAALNTLVDVMDLRTAWVFLWTKNFRPTFSVSQDAPHDFLLAGSCNLPKGLEKNNHHYLSHPPDCRCQHLLRNKRLARAVNVVECSRIREANLADGDTEGLRYHATVPIIAQDQPLGILNIASKEWELFNASDLKLLSMASDHIANAIKRAELYDKTENQRSSLNDELERARNVQASFMPEELPEIEGFSLAAEWNPALKVAGDFYDIFSMNENRWGIVIADVSGKGTPSALYSERVHTLIQEVSRRHTKPSDILTTVNQLLLGQSSDGMFVTVFYAVLDPVSSVLTYSNGGHDGPFLRRSSGKIERLEHGGPVLAVFEDPSLDDTKIKLEPGDAFIAYTDGVIDAVNDEGEYYGAARLESAISTAVDPSNASAIKEHLVDDLAAFTQDAPQEDDITLFVVARE